MTGDRGIEDRFSEAVGLPLSEEGGQLYLSGFPAEGNPVLYLAVPGTLLFILHLLNCRFMAKPD